MTDALWWIFGALALGGALGTVTRKSPVASLLFLVLTFFSLAVLYILLGAPFIAAMQVIVYAGAIMVLFLFVIMLLNLGHAYRSDLRGGGWIAAGSVVAGLIGYAVSRMLRAGGPELGLAADAGAVKAATQENAVKVIADPLFRDFVVPFELTSVLLLVAVIGAVLLAKRRV